MRLRVSREIEDTFSVISLPNGANLHRNVNIASHIARGPTQRHPHPHLPRRQEPQRLQRHAVYPFRRFPRPRGAARKPPRRERRKIVHGLHYGLIRRTHHPKRHRPVPAQHRIGMFHIQRFQVLPEFPQERCEIAIAIGNSPARHHHAKQTRRIRRQDVLNPLRREYLRIPAMIKCRGRPRRLKVRQVEFVAEFFCEVDVQRLNLSRCFGLRTKGGTPMLRNNQAHVGPLLANPRLTHVRVRVRAVKSQAIAPESRSQRDALFGDPHRMEGCYDGQARPVGKPTQTLQSPWCR